MAASTAFEMFSPTVKKWVHMQGWDNLRDIQEMAAAAIFSADSDVIISASTASGKTEAAFLPALSRLEFERTGGIGILYIAPLKALINDQARRLETLCEMMQLPLTPWHGDVAQSKKAALRKNPQGVLLITPESLEAMLMQNMGFAKRAFQNLQYVIIDEFHAFIGTERGMQLKSLLHRLEYLTERRPARVALSATLGDLAHVKPQLQSRVRRECHLITSDAQKTDLKVQMKGYLNIDGPESTPALDLMIEDLYRILRSHSNLVFANSRNRTELLAVRLSERCETDHVPNEFFAHHGNISKEIREHVEKRLQEGKLPTSVIATQTLELGIDIGSVDSVAQVTPPHSVASLRQRLGRSGRRGSPAVLRMLIDEEEIASNSHIVDLLRVKTVQMTAMMNLLLKKWYEPTDEMAPHYSTLIQQILSVISQYGGMYADRLYNLLCKTGPFERILIEEFVQILRSLGDAHLITQMQDGQLVLGDIGELMCSNYQFYTAFVTSEDYRLEYNGRSIGQISFDRPLVVDQHIVFAAKRWQIVSIENETKTIQLIPAAGGEPPTFGGEGMNLAGEIRKEMQRMYMSREIPAYMDARAKENMNEGIGYFHELGLAKNSVLVDESTIYIIPWQSDRVINTVALLLKLQGLDASEFAGVIEIRRAGVQDLQQAIARILSDEDLVETNLAQHVADIRVEKHDSLVPEELLEQAYNEKYFNLMGARDFLLTI